MVYHRRHIAKAITWRIIAALTTASVAYGITGDIDISTKILAIDSIIKVGMYYIHERVWYRTKWGIK